MLRRVGRPGLDLFEIGHASRTGFRACVATSAPNRQGLKPFTFQTLSGTVETVPYKDFLVATGSSACGKSPVAQRLFAVRFCRPIHALGSNELSKNLTAKSGCATKTQVVKKAA